MRRHRQHRKSRCRIAVAGLAQANSFLMSGKYGCVIVALGIAP